MRNETSFQKEQADDLPCDHRFSSGFFLRWSKSSGANTVLPAFGVNAEGEATEVTITEDDLKAIENDTNTTSEVKGILITVSGITSFDCSGAPGTEPVPKLRVMHGSDSEGVDTVQFKTSLGNFRRIE